MTVKIAPPPRQQFLDSNGDPYSGAKLFTYTAGTTTKENTYTTSVGDVANTNPIILDSSGRTPSGVWLTAGVNYKFVLAPSTDTDPPASPIFTEDVISGTNDTATITGSQWAASAMTPTYVSATQFTVVGDQTSTLDVGRRCQFTVSAGTVYGNILTSVYTSLTTVTMTMDSGDALDAGLSSFNVGILSGTNHSVPKLTDAKWTQIGVAVVGSANTFTGNDTHSGDNTFSGSDTHTGVKDFTGAAFAGAVPVVFEGNTADAFEGSIAVADFTADRTFTFPDKDVDFGKIIDTPDIDATVASNAMTITINPGVLAFRSTTLTDGTPTVISLDSAITVVIPDTATLGSTSSEDTYYVVLAINNAGTVEAAVVNLAGHVDLDEDALISTTAIDATADSATVIYSTTARSNVAFRIMGIVKHNQSTAGTYAAAPDLVQSAYGNNYANEIAASSKTYTSPSRSAATDYVNTTGRRIMVFAQTNSAANATMICLVDGVEIQDLHTASANNAVFTSSFVVPPGSTYRVNLTNYTLVDWKEIEL